MRRPKMILEIGIGDAVDEHGRRETLGINLGYIGCKTEIACRGFEFVQIGFERARIFAEILAWRELRRVDENRYDDAIGLAPRPFDERDVPGMKRAHRRHERDALARLAPARHDLAQPGDIANDRRPIPSAQLVPS